MTLLINDYDGNDDDDDEYDGSIDWAVVGYSFGHLTFALLRGSSGYLGIGVLSLKG